MPGFDEDFLVTNVARYCGPAHLPGHFLERVHVSVDADYGPASAGEPFYYRFADPVGSTSHDDRVPPSPVVLWIG